MRLKALNQKIRILTSSSRTFQRLEVNTHGWVNVHAQENCFLIFRLEHQRREKNEIDVLPYNSLAVPLSIIYAVLLVIYHFLFILLFCLNVLLFSVRLSMIRLEWKGSCADAWRFDQLAIQGGFVRRIYGKIRWISSQLRSNWENNN